jgi:hypothetical protein
MMTDEEFIKKLKKEAYFEHTGDQKEILWGRLRAYLDVDEAKGGFWYFGFRFAHLVVVVAVVLLASAGVTFASQTSLPGEPLYSVKRLSEEAKIFVIFDQKTKQKERIKLTSRRVGEVEQLASKDPGKAEELLGEYESQIENYENAFNEDPELSESLESTLMANKEVFMRVVDEAPDQLKTRINELIEEPDEEEPEEESGGTVEGEQDNPANDPKEEEDPNLTGD